MNRCAMTNGLFSVLYPRSDRLPSCSTFANDKRRPAEAVSSLFTPTAATYRGGTARVLGGTALRALSGVAGAVTEEDGGTSS
jgi:hypothetical protein